MIQKSPFNISSPGLRQAVVFIDWNREGANDWSVATAKSAMTFNPGVPIYVVTDEADGAAQNMRSECPEAPRSQFHVVDVGSLQNKDQREVSFMKDYVHSSVNPLSYERNCFRRFFWLQQLMKTTGISHALLADADILFLDNVFRYYGLTEKRSFFALSSSSSYFSYWSIQALDEFCNYIFSFYQRPKEQIFVDIEKYGIFRGPGASVQQPAAEGWPSWMPPKQFSDMWIFAAFLDHHPDLQVNLQFPGQQRGEVWKPRAIMHDVKAKTGSCYTQDNVTSQEFQWLEVAQGKNRVLMPIVNGIRVPALHFQGDCKGSIVGAAKRIGIPCPSA